MRTPEIIWLSGWTNRVPVAGRAAVAATLGAPLIDQACHERVDIVEVDVAIAVDVTIKPAAAGVTVFVAHLPDQRHHERGNVIEIDAAIAMQSMVLAATAEGLGTCWIAAFRENELKKVLGIPEEVRVISLTTLGYPAVEKGPVTRRKTIDELVRYDHW